jgi:hypothetical protein
MGKIPNNARRTNRRGRRTKGNFRARSGKSVRTVSTAQILTISNVPNDILEAIDELAAMQDRSRSSFVRRELERIVAEYRTKNAFRSPTPRN